MGTRYLNARTRRGEERKGNRLLLEPGLEEEQERERQRDDDADGGGKSVGSVISGDPQVAFDKSPMKAILLAEPLGTKLSLNLFPPAVRLSARTWAPWKGTTNVGKLLELFQL